MNIVTVERIRVRFQRQRDNTLLHKDKDLSTSWLFYKSVPDDKRKSERKRQTDRDRDRETQSDRQIDERAVPSSSAIPAVKIKSNTRQSFTSLDLMITESPTEGG